MSVYRGCVWGKGGGIYKCDGAEQCVYGRVKLVKKTSVCRGWIYCLFSCVCVFGVWVK